MTFRTPVSCLCVALLHLALLSFGQHARSEESGAYARQRQKMIDQALRGRGIRDTAVLSAMSTVPRHLFVDPALRNRAYGDHPLPIGEGQTISQPYVVALMTEALRLNKSDRVLEVGAGSGYQAAVLAEIVREVYTIEIRQTLASGAARLLDQLGYQNVHVRSGDGYYGWAEHGPYDAIIITAQANHIPPPLLEQLKEGGRLILPLGRTFYYQVLTLVTKRKGKMEMQQLGEVAFVPMVGEMRRDR